MSATRRSPLVVYPPDECAADGGDGEWPGGCTREADTFRRVHVRAAFQLRSTTFAAISQRQVYLLYQYIKRNHMTCTPRSCQSMEHCGSKRSGNWQVARGSPQGLKTRVVKASAAIHRELPFAPGTAMGRRQLEAVACGNHICRRLPAQSRRSANTRNFAARRFMAALRCNGRPYAPSHREHFD